MARRGVEAETTNTDYSLYLRHELTDRLTVELDGQYAKSRVTNTDFSVFGSLFADQELDISGEYPVSVPHAPQFLGYTWSTNNVSPELDAIIVRDADGNPTTARDDAAYFGDPRFQFWRAAMDHIEDSRGEQYAFRGDFTYEFDEDSFLRRLKFGARYQGREQDVRYTTYNWGRLSEVWTGSRPINFADTPADASVRYDFPNFFRGETAPPPGAFYYNGNPAAQYDETVAFVRTVQDLAVQSGAEIDWQPLADRDNRVIAGTPFLPSEVQTIDQDDYAAYLMASFGSDDLFGNIRFTGNAGVRYVNTQVLSASSRGPGSQADLGIQDPFEVRCAARDRPAELGGGQVVPGGICTIGQEAYESLRNFADGSLRYQQGRNNYDYWLPSVNLKFGLTDDLIFRLAGSKVLTRPENAYIRNYFTPSVDTVGRYFASAGDPTLLPATAWQFDASIEWYFARVGSLTLNGFYKDISNFFYQQVRNETIRNAAGEERTVEVRGPANFDGNGKVKGFEVAYQQTFDFLPSPLDGFGASANYTFIDSSGLPNTFLNGGEAVNNSTIVPSGNLPLEQLSKHNYNIAGFYEKGPISLRAAYNWRSRFLLTASDVIFPYYSIFNEPTGQLDASIFFNIGEIAGLPGDVRIGVQGVNLLNEVTKTTQAYTGDPDVLAPRSYFMNDRRFSFILRGNF